MMKDITLFALVAAVMGAIALPSLAHAEPVLISQQPWGSDTADTTAMTTVFGTGKYLFDNSFASATVSSVFTAANRFVMIEGGGVSDTAFQSYLSTNSTAILAWVAAGGQLLLQSAGWNAGTYGIGPDSLIQDNYAHATRTGTLTAAGIKVFPTAAVTEIGNYLAHDYVTGPGTVYMTGIDGVSILQGDAYGAGYIMYSGLTTSQYNDAGSVLIKGAITYTDKAAVPEPMSLALLGVGMIGTGVMARRRRSALTATAG